VDVGYDDRDGNHGDREQPEDQGENRRAIAGLRPVIA
jgi:hypothetical protein